ncbi:hypothetical protein FWF48_02080 [Candidatus Saccharibacteria bacterium]|nr:hypothetical protein [Candidatus Saccharibacteria bacterium]
MTKSSEHQPNPENEQQLQDGPKAGLPSIEDVGLQRLAKELTERGLPEDATWMDIKEYDESHETDVNPEQKTERERAAELADYVNRHMIDMYKTVSLDETGTPDEYRLEAFKRMMEYEQRAKRDKELARGAGDMSVHELEYRKQAFDKAELNAGLLRSGIIIGNYEWEDKARQAKQAKLSNFELAMQTSDLRLEELDSVAYEKTMGKVIDELNVLGVAEDPNGELFKKFENSIDSAAKAEDTLEFIKLVKDIDPRPDYDWHDDTPDNKYDSDQHCARLIQLASNMGGQSGVLVHMLEESGSISDWQSIVAGYASSVS